jgi:hypothetical protein
MRAPSGGRDQSSEIAAAPLEMVPSARETAAAPHENASHKARKYRFAKRFMMDDSWQCRGRFQGGAAADLTAKRRFKARKGDFNVAKLSSA